tara:strand:+ start:393 stop:659 length:267 start_codon:yes stop_codon:yes gene_type:complete
VLESVPEYASWAGAGTDSVLEDASWAGAGAVFVPLVPSVDDITRHDSGLDGSISKPAPQLKVDVFGRFSPEVSEFELSSVGVLSVGGV